LVFDSINSGGLIIADNVLWSGKVMEKRQNKDTALLDAFNKKIHADARVENILLPIRDGLLLARKI
jgi:predicted O-methyltransferase YrrM